MLRTILTHSRTSDVSTIRHLHTLAMRCGYHQRFNINISKARATSYKCISTRCYHSATVNANSTTHGVTPTSGSPSPLSAPDLTSTPSDADRTARLSSNDRMSLPELTANPTNRVIASSSDMTPEEFAMAGQGGPATMVISIDRSGLLGVHSQEEEICDDQSHKSKHTPMVDELRSQIAVKGPLSVADWMFQCLQHPRYGYYTSRKAASVIGGKGKNSHSSATPSTAVASEIRTQSAATVPAAASAEAAITESESDLGGDFITSPELGQIFGEMLGVWVIQVWERLGKPHKFQLVELGPGKGTLMRDVLLAASRFPDFMRAVSVHLLETSPPMREAQAQALNVQNVKRQFIESTDNQTISLTTKDRVQHPFTSPIRSQSEKDSIRAQYMSGEKEMSDLKVTGEIPLPIRLPGSDESKVASWPPPKSAVTSSIPISWHSKVSQLTPDGGPLIVLAHEFFDALPVYQFVLTERGWCEKLVDSDRGKGPHHLRFVLSAHPTGASHSFLPPSKFPPQDSKIGAAVEISGTSLACMEDLSFRLSACGGAALVIDYGTNHPNTNTLQAVQKHQFKHVLEEPGQVDLTALVDFKSLRAAVERTNQLVTSPLRVEPLVSQSHFLRNLNIAARLEVLVQKAMEDDKFSDSDVDTLIDNATRLVETDTTKGGMGLHFKCMAIVSQQLQQGEPIIPFNFPDPLIQAEDAKYEVENPTLVRKTNGGLLDSHPRADRPRASEHRFSSVPPAEKPKPVQTNSPLANATEKRRASAREAAQQLAKARADKEAAAAAAAAAPVPNPSATKT